MSEAPRTADGDASPSATPLGAPAAQPSARQDDERPMLVLVHGIFDSGRRYRAMVRALEAAGIECFAPDLTPSHGGARLEHLAEQLAEKIDARVEAGRPIHLLAFSMGALISRWYLQACGGLARARQFIAIAAPFHGSWWCWLYPAPGSMQMRPGSEFLQRLDAQLDQLLQIPVTCVWTPMDLVILPARSSVLPGADNHTINSFCHPCLLYHPQVINLVREKVFALADGSTPREAP